MERFLFEVCIMAKFSYFNIVIVYVVGEYEGVFYIVLEYLCG